MAATHLRRRLDRWALQVLPGHRLDRAMRASRLIAAHCHPRVWAAYLRALCNGWCTRRRFQSRGACRFGCGGHEDSIEHMAFCNKVRELWQRHLCLAPPPPGQELDIFLCLEVPVFGNGVRQEGFPDSAQALCSQALGLFALHCTHNSLRHGRLGEDEIDGAFREHLRDGRRTGGSQ